MLNNALQAVKKQKEFINRAAKNFISAFTKQTAKLVKVEKAREERQKVISPQLPAFFNKPKL